MGSLQLRYSLTPLTSCGHAVINVLCDGWEFVYHINPSLQLFPWQVVLRWGVQRGYSVIPKSENPERMAANLAVEGFSLSEEDMAAVNSLERGFRFNDPGHFCPLAFSTQCPIWD